MVGDANFISLDWGSCYFASHSIVASWHQSMLFLQHLLCMTTNPIVSSVKNSLMCKLTQIGTSFVCCTDTSIVDFRDLFGYEQSEVERIAEHYNDTNFDASLNNEIAWVDVAVGSTLNVTGSEIGSGLLIVNGSAHFGGTYQFSGIVYVLGTLTARGTFDAYGTVMVASTSDIANNSVNGNPDFYYNTTEITNALTRLADKFVRIVSWRETQ